MHDTTAVDEPTDNATGISPRIVGIEPVSEPDESLVAAIVSRPPTRPKLADPDDETAPQSTSVLDWGTGNRVANSTSGSCVILPPPPRRLPYAFRLLQQWEATVTTVGQDEFTALLDDLTDAARPREEAVFDLDEVSPGDLELVKPGAVFRWNIGYRTSVGGQRERVSYLHFVRIPGWRRSVVSDVVARGVQLRQQFSLHGNERNTA